MAVGGHLQTLAQDPGGSSFAVGHRGQRGERDQRGPDELGAGLDAGRREIGHLCVVALDASHRGTERIELGESLDVPVREVVDRRHAGLVYR